jgi:type IV pilus assembly protein PilY1
MNSSRPSAFRKFCAGVVAVALIVQPLGAYAAKITTSTLAEVPLQGLNPVKPNIMFTLDDSGSMNDEYLPDFVGEGTPPPSARYCRDAQNCGRFSDIADPPIRSSNFNGQFYNPTATYLPGKNADAVDLPCEGADNTCPGPWTNVYSDGFKRYPNPNTSTTVNLNTGYPDTAWCNNQASEPPSAADMATAFGDGSKCRLNGRAYAAFTDPSNVWKVPSVAAGFNYPNVGDVSTGSDTACQSANEYCVFSTPAAVSGSPYYYTISKVQFCSTKDANGFGAAPCQDRWDPTYKYVRYGTAPTKSFDPQAFTRVEITPTGFRVNGGLATTTNPSGSARTPAEEMTNFAKWYTFYRKRILAMKTAGGIAFSRLSENNARVGFHTLWENANLFVNIRAFDASQKMMWFEKFYAAAPARTTPLPDAVFRVGEYFSNSGNSGLPGAIDPLDATTGKCQPNYHLLSTDGYWNIALSAGNVGDRDQNVPGNLPGPIPGFTSGSAFPRPQYEGPTTSGNSLADLSMHYWINDLRPTLDNRVKDTIAPWQHVTLYGLSIGAQGSVDDSGLAAITAGTANWPQPMGSGGPDSIDDLWHATLNSRGKFFNAANPQQLAESIVSAVADFIGTQSGTGTAVGIAGAQFTATKKFGYRTSYEAAWWGDVRKYALDSSTGALPLDSAGNPKDAPLWSAAAQLDTMAAGTGWDTNRRIVTIKDDGKAIPFRLASLATSQKDSLADAWFGVASPPTDQQVLDYLRGDKSNEGSGTTNFRKREHILGDIVYSGAVPVGAPGQPYDDVGNPGYTTFATSKQSRTPIVYVGGNDGMLHALDDSNTTNAGKETWAFIPRALFNSGDPNNTTPTPLREFQLGALTYRTGAFPMFDHKFYVNATPRVWDIDFKNTNTQNPPKTKEDSDWHTILVGGLGAGGRSVYALDVTTPVGPAETEAGIASSRVLWEFTDDNLGYVFDAPTLVKTQRYGWVVLVSSGYNNKDGDGKLFVINPTDGKLLKTLSTGVGSGNDPSGLSTIRAYTPSRKDPYVLQAYGGDLKGNVWRFDLSDPDETNWKVELIAKLADASGKAQPITTGVRIEIDQNNNVDRYLFVGTGQLLDQKDLNDNTAANNTLYVIRDGTRTAAEPAPLTPYSRTNLSTVVAGQVAGFTGTATGRGWYQDASDPKEKIGTDVFADVQTVVYSFSKPADDPCEAALTSNLFARDLLTGNSVLQSAGGDVVASITDIGAIAGVALIQGQAGTGSSASGDVRAQVTTMKGQVFSFGVKLAGGAASKHRVSWRLLNRE